MSEKELIKLFNDHDYDLSLHDNGWIRIINKKTWLGGWIIMDEDTGEFNSATFNLHQAMPDELRTQLYNYLGIGDKA